MKGFKKCRISSAVEGTDVVCCGIAVKMKALNVKVVIMTLIGEVRI